MGDPLYVNGRFTTTDEKVIGVEDRGFLFGDAVYEVLKFRRRRPAFIREHFIRLERSLAALEIPRPFDVSEFGAICAELLSRAQSDDGILYLQITRGDGPRLHVYAEGMTPTVVMYTRAFTFPDDAKLDRGISVVTMEDQRWARCDIKSVNLLPNALAKKKAARASADEAIFMHDGFIREGASSNFFIVAEGRLVTHTSDENVLSGVVRDRVIALALERRIRVDERPIRYVEVPQADEVFITSTTQGVMPVTTFDGHAVRSGRCGVLTRELQRAFLTLEASHFAR